jgi:site-specific recombinase XerD
MNLDFKYQEEKTQPKECRIIPLHPLQVKAINLEKHVEEFIAWRQVAKNTAMNYRSVLNKMLKECGEPLNWNCIQDYINSLHYNYKESHVFRVSNTLKKFFEYLDSHTEFENKVYNRLFIKKYRYEGGNKDVISDKKFLEIYKLFDFRKSADIRDYAILKLLQSTGMRVGEPFRIKISDIKTISDAFGNNYTIIDSTQKGGRRLVCRVHDGTLKAINTYLRTRGFYDKNEPLFIQHKFHFNKNERYKPLNVTVFCKRIKQLFEAVGLEDYSSHSIRYTAAFKTLNATNDETKASAKLGHISPKTIQYYTHNYRLELNAINDTNIELNTK